MEYLKTNGAYVLRLQRGEEILDSMEKFCLKENILAASVTGIGAADYAQVGVYDTIRREYKKTTLSGPMEILSLAGNITEKDEKPYLHLHIVLGNDDCTCLGGHLNMARISVTCEIVITPIAGRITRVPDDETGINLMAFNA